MIGSVNFALRYRLTGIESARQHTCVQKQQQQHRSPAGLAILGRPVFPGNHIDTGAGTVPYRTVCVPCQQLRASAAASQETIGLLLSPESPERRFRQALIKMGTAAACLHQPTNATVFAMATMQRRLVHKQFNSPINLYSQRNIQETLDRELKLLSNGAIGIDFEDPATTKPPSLAKSAVLQALEDEERQQARGLKRVAWPPPQAEGGDDYYQQQQQQQPSHPPQQQYYQQQQQPSPQFQHHQQPTFQQPSYQPYSQQQQQHPQQQQQHQQAQHQPRERIIPIQRSDPSTQQPQYQPQATQAFQPLASAQQQQQLYQHPPEPTVVPQQPYYQQPDQIPFVTTLRKEPPMSQEPAPVYQTQPVAAIYQGGTNMRGDQKWPPAEYKKQSELENEERRRLAQQPAFRPRKVQKDYSDFFAKNALNQTYPAYRAPPGTQHHD
ncbi:putative mediator of RNA polymerase II transcription subunit 26 [Sabethes cyaneus]|uniref:putative mediator of RNA polymerase II transcription subunit 26 n=1 Tax=Sabethes cyaneus TaxID=53552 RepID=UPI00237DA0CE|nr:putative mediator of RNA polymerase II transcription subunit 26 [Sabethes cyaneus]